MRSVVLLMYACIVLQYTGIVLNAVQLRTFLGGFLFPDLDVDEL